LFFENNEDGIFVSRFQNDFCSTRRTRRIHLRAAGIFGRFTKSVVLEFQRHVDRLHEYWANFVESGRPAIPLSCHAEIDAVFRNFVRGVYTMNEITARPISSI